MHSLSPPMEVIEQSLFAPSSALVERWTRGDATIDPALAQALDASPEARRRRAAMLAELHQPVTLAENAAAPPPFVQDLIRRRVAAQHRAFALQPKAGQVRLIQAVIGPDGPLPVDLPRPLAVLLSEPAERRDVWYGWVTAEEVDYASWWDCLLEPEDEPFDPLAGMVQVWNEAYVYLPSTARAIAELSPARVAAVRAMATDYATAPDPDSSLACPGRMAARSTQHGHHVLTGTPLAAGPDPRRRYQQLYRRAAEVAILQPARLALAQPSLTERVIASIRQALQQLGRAFEPMPEVAHAMGEAGGEDCYRVADDLDLTVVERDADTVQIHLQLVGSRPLQIALRQQEILLKQSVLSPDAPEDNLFFDASRPHHLTVSTSDGVMLYSLPLTP